MPAPKYIPHYTIADYRRWEGDWELWDGIPIAMTPSPFGPHQRLLAMLTYCFVDAIKRAGCKDCAVVVELDWIIDAHTIVRPDLSIVCGETLDQFIERPPKLIVEILSSGTSHRDRNEKRMLYQEQGVRHYLIADPSPAAIEHFKLGPDGRYEAVRSDAPERPFALSKDCRIQVNLQEL